MHILLLFACAAAALPRAYGHYGFSTQREYDDWVASVSVGISGHAIDIGRLVTLETGLWLRGHSNDTAARDSVAAKVEGICEALSIAEDTYDIRPCAEFFRGLDGPPRDRSGELLRILARCSLYDSDMAFISRGDPYKLVRAKVDAALAPVRAKIDEDTHVDVGDVLKKVGM